MRRVPCSAALTLLIAALVASGCVTTSMQGYADRDLPAKPVSRIAALVLAPGSMAPAIQSSIINEAQNHHIQAEDALLIFPPTRAYSNAEIQQGLARDHIDAVLTVNVGDSGVMRQYAGTIFQGQSTNNFYASGTTTTFGNMTSTSLNGTSYGTSTGIATPIYRYSRQTAFTARLVESATGRTLWVGNGQVRAGGLLFVGDGTSASSSISAIFDDLQKKGLIAPASS
jgi:hypothetical protein